MPHPRRLAVVLGCVVLVLGLTVGPWVAALARAEDVVDQGTVHDDPARCRRLQEALEDRRELLRWANVDPGPEVATALGAGARVLVGHIAYAQAHARHERGRHATGLDELRALLGPGTDLAPDGTARGYAFEVGGDGATWTLAATPRCPACRDVAATFEVDARGVKTARDPRTGRSSVFD